MTKSEYMKISCKQRFERSHYKNEKCFIISANVFIKSDTTISFLRRKQKIALYATIACTY